LGLKLACSYLRVLSGGFVTGFAPAFSPSEKIFGFVESPAAEPRIDARTLAGGRDTQLLKVAPGYRVAVGIEVLDALNSRQTGHDCFLSALGHLLVAFQIALCDTKSTMRDNM
jgi:hypothetical protein